jgi:hypothetical protein
MGREIKIGVERKKVFAVILIMVMVWQIWGKYYVHNKNKEPVDTLVVPCRYLSYVFCRFSFCTRLSFLQSSPAVWNHFHFPQ